MIPEDAAWAAQLMERRRQVYATYSPVFWKPATGATGLHARYLGALLRDGRNIGLRSERAFLIGQEQGAEYLVDDFALDQGGTWDSDGRDLLAALWDLVRTSTQQLRVVTARADREKVAGLEASGLALDQQWWVKPLASRGQAAPHPAIQVRGAGFSGLFGPAPPVYDPGVPVLRIDPPVHLFQLAELEEWAAALGAVLAILPVPPAAATERELERRQWSVASQWYVGQPGTGPRE